MKKENMRKSELTREKKIIMGRNINYENTGYFL